MQLANGDGVGSSYLFKLRFGRDDSLQHTDVEIRAEINSETVRKLTPNPLEANPVVIGNALEDGCSKSKVAFKQTQQMFVSPGVEAVSVRIFVPRNRTAKLRYPVGPRRRSVLHFLDRAV